MSRRPGAVALIAIMAVVLRPTAAFAQDDLVDVTVLQFGVGNSYRPGDFVGLRIQLTAKQQLTDEAAASVWVQWEVPNADGDIAEFGREMPLQTGQPRKTWLYAPLRPLTQSGDIWKVRVFLFENGQRGREVGGARIGTAGSTRVEPYQGMIGVLGGARMALNGYGFVNTGQGSIVTSHDEVRLVRQIESTGLPDRREGLNVFDVLVWTPEEPPAQSLQQATAVLEWVRRGGHLVIVLPEDTNPWGLGEGSSFLAGILPTKAPRKDNDVPVTDLMPILSKAKGLDPDAPNAFFTIGIQVFQDGDLDRLDNGWEPMIWLEDGRVVVVQRTFGHGRITLVGIDISDGRFQTRPLSNGTRGPVIQADVFWNRVLGRRCDTPTPSELAEMQTADRLSGRTPSRLVVGDGPIFTEKINMSGAAATGLLIALFLFIGYWVVAGPGGFAVLKYHRRAHHAWIAFTAAAGLFTALAWAAVSVLRANDISAQHLTFLDHVARPPGTVEISSDPQLQRATSWFSIYLPGYGEAELDVESMEASGVDFPAQRDLVVHWTPPGQTVQSVPNVDRYRVDVVRGIDGYAVPKRSTASHMYAQWLGALDPQWGGMLMSDPKDPVRVEMLGTQETLRGSIVNNLPGTLKDVTIIWVKSRRNRGRFYESEQDAEMKWIRSTDSGMMLNAAQHWRPGSGKPWAPGTALPLQKPTGQGNTTIASSFEKRYYKDYNQDGFNAPIGTSMNQSEKKRRDAMFMLGFFQQMQPPAYLKTPGQAGDAAVRFERLLGRELDLSAWFSRPCVIIVGQLDDVASPVPLRVDGRPVDSTGTVIVRWVYPLPLETSVLSAFEEPAERALPRLPAPAEREARD
jgi:hypothetical protein